jgi:hypothetical protein
VVRAHGRHERDETCLVAKTERKSQLGRPRHRWEDNIRMDLMEIGHKIWTGFIWFRIGTSGKSL